MAKKFEISKSAYYKSESGVHCPDFKTMNLLQEEYHISMDWLIFNKGPQDFQSKLKVIDLDKGQQKLAADQETLQREATALKGVREDVKEYEAIDKIMPGVKELLEHMANNPKLRYRILLEFHNYKDQPGKDEAVD